VTEERLDQSARRILRDKFRLGLLDDRYALLATFGASDAALLEVLFGCAAPDAKLPFELPRSMDAVRRQLEDVPCDSEDPLFPFGFGLSY
jgi:hypothetical protein